ncbi:prolyl oligopeptidase family serine peptidase [Luteimonas sp. MJ250]|uniref:alpha/beta hydrolase family protein n=1 Tax=Luteimonas sp. MJ250 TaxID=3129236 RepID=UPI0031BA4C86
MKHAIRATIAVAMGLAATCVQAAEPVPIEAFAVADRTSAPRLSPDGLHVAATTHLGEGSYAIEVRRVSDLVQTAQLTLPRYELPSQIYWVSNKRLLVAKGRLIGAREAPIPMGEIIATDYDGSNQKYVYGYRQSTRMPGIDRGYGYIEGLPPTPNGHFYMRRLSNDTSRSMLYDVDAERATHRLIADIGVKDLGFVLDPAGMPRFAGGYDDNDDYRLYEADARGKDWQPVATERTGGHFRPIAFTADAGGVFARHNIGDGPSTVVKSDPTGASRVSLASDSFGSVGGMEWNASWQPFAATLVHGRPRVVYFDEHSGDAQEHRALSGLFPGHHMSYANHSVDGQLSLLRVVSDRDPGMWYLYDRTEATARLLFASREGIDPERMGERRYFRFKASDGMELDGYLTIPAGQEPAGLPMVLLPHGGPHAEGDDWTFDTDAQFLASRGYLVLQVNFRGTLGRGDRFTTAGYRNWGTRIQDDLIDGVRWAIAQGHADPQRVCAYGASFGAYSAMMTAIRAPELIKCVAGLAGLYDLKVFAGKSDVASRASGRRYISRVIGDSDETLRANSPVALAAQVKAPVFMAHGEIDERTPYSQALAMKRALEAAGASPEWMSVPREGHGFYKDENNIAFYRRLEAFLERHIGTE